MRTGVYMNAAFAVVLFAITGMAWGGEGKIDSTELLRTAPERIEKIRKGNVTIQVKDGNGNAIPEAKVHVEQMRHAFLFGANIFPLLTYQKQGKDAYEKQFAALLNYATLGFYWGSYEPEQGQISAGQERNEKIARWCQEHGIATKGHPLVWHQAYPKWAPGDADETKKLLQARIQDIVPHFKGLTERWDVINETTVSAKNDNGVGHWVKRDGTAAVVGQVLDWVHAANPEATLLYNDFNVGKDFEKLCAELTTAKKPMGAIGVQSHMHSGKWSLEKAWTVAETYGKFGLPVHFTETTVISGPQRKIADWNKAEKDWNTTPEDEATQADYVEKLYTIWFSNPHVQAITWWDFQDGAWLGAPAGLIRKDLTPKPVYGKLMKLIKEDWWTRSDLTTDTKGACKLRGMLGHYKVRAEANGKNAEKEFDLKDGEEWKMEVK